MTNATHEPAADPIGPAETRWMIFWGTTGVLVWFGLFGLGLLINSASYREKVGRELDAHNFVMSIVTFTPTNVGLICLVAVVGALPEVRAGDWLGQVRRWICAT